MQLVESIEGCADCAAEEAYKLSIGHTCGEPSAKWTTFCELVRHGRQRNRKYHRLSHKPVRCQECGGITDDHRGNVHVGFRQCASGQCDEWFCEHCGAVVGSAGLVGCPTCGSFRDGKE